MDLDNTSAGGPPSRPPPPSFQGAPPPYMEPQGATSPGAPPGGAPLPPPYGGPPPGYYPPPPNQMGNPYPWGYQMPPNQVPQACPQGNSALYPDISALPQPQPVPYGFGIGGGPQTQPDPSQIPPGAPATGPPPVPVRPAPNPPGYNLSSGCPYGNYPPSGQGEAPWWSKLKDLEAPPGCVISWKGGEGMKLYFLQEDGNIVSPKKPLEMAVFKRINGKGGEVLETSLLGMVEVVGCWRLRLHGKNSFCLHSYQNIYVFLDDSTNPSKSGRIVIIELPEEVSRTMRGDLCALLHEMTDLKEEQEGVVGKLTTNVGSVYNDLTKKLNTAVKDVVPGAHKSTKWIRKGTGSLVRMGGNLVTKGMHIIADQMPTSHSEQEVLEYEESPVHSELMEGLLNFRKSVESGTITYI